MQYTRLVPLLNRVLIRRLERVNKTASGIILNKEKEDIGIVVDVGEGERLKNGTYRKTNVKIGDRVMIPDYGGYSLKLQGGDFIIMKDTDLIAIIH
ncbi:10 kda heat shock protein [Paramecium bursaria]